MSEIGSRLFEPLDRLSSFNQILNIPEGHRLKWLDYLESRLGDLPTKEQKFANWRTPHFDLDIFEKKKTIALNFIETMDPSYDPKEAKRSSWYKTELQNEFAAAVGMIEHYDRDDLQQGISQTRERLESMRIKK